MKTDLFILAKCFKIKNMARDFIYSIQMISISEIGSKTSCRDTEPMHLFQEKFIRENLKKEINKGMENVFILMADNMKAHGRKTIK